MSAMISHNVHSMRSILLLEHSYLYCKDRWDALAQENNYKLVFCEASSPEEFLEYFKNHNIEILVNTWYGAAAIGKYNPALVKQLKGLKAVIHQGAGYDVLGDIGAWTDIGVQVANAPTYVAPSTADTAVFLAFAAMRRFNRLQTSLRTGQWLGTLPVEVCHDPEGATVSIVGMGNIGRQIKDRLIPFGFKKIQYFNRSRASPEAEAGAEWVDLETVWTTSDVIVFACPLTDQTRHLLNAESISKCKTGVNIVNIARGPVIHEQALVDALRSGQVGSAGLDVFEFEPKIHPDLLTNDDVFLLPHAATHSLETRANVENELIENCYSFINTGKLKTLVPQSKAGLGLE